MAKIVKSKSQKKRTKKPLAPLFLQKKRQSKTSNRGSAYDKIYFSKRPPLPYFSRGPIRRFAAPVSVVLYSMDYGRLSKEEIEAARRIIRKKTTKRGKLFIKAYAYIPVTRKPKEVRMGKGKGKISEYASFVRPGKPIFELRRTSVKSAVLAFQSAQSKLSVFSKIRVVQLPA